MSAALQVLVLLGTIALVGASCAITPGPPPPSPASILMSPDTAYGFFSMPWPNDVRTGPQGHPDLDGWPGVAIDPLRNDPLPKYPIMSALVSNLANAVSGFGTNSAIYLQATADLDRSSFPAPHETTDPSSPVQVVDLATGERAPVIVEIQSGDRFRPDHLVTVLPYPGHPLKPDTRYGVIVTDGLRAASGEPLRPAPLIAALDESRSGPGSDAWGRWRVQRDEIREIMAAGPVGPEHLVAFTVFRTQNVREDMNAVARAVEADRPEVRLSPTLDCSVGWGSAYFDGTISLPRFQTGTYPYLTAGGAIVTGSDGAAVIQGRSDVPLRVRVPCGTPPASGWPILEFVDGTGGGASTGVGTVVSTEGWIVASIGPVYGADRELDSATRSIINALASGFGSSYLLYYNLLNPTAARSNPIQQASEQLGLLRAIERITFPGAPLDAAAPVGTDDATEVVSGHSQGAETLPLVASVAPDIEGIFSSAGSGGGYHTLAHLLQNRQALANVTGSAELLDELNPLIQLVQTLQEAGDGINYPNDNNFLYVSGAIDTCVPVEGSSYFAAALGLETVTAAPAENLYGDAALEPPSVVGPGTYGPAASGRLRLNVQFTGGHFSAYAHPGVGQQFLDAVRDHVPPTIDTGPLESYGGGCGGGRWDIPPRRYAK